jgi:L-ribulose-5-phosphate 3-epimerase
MNHVNRRQFLQLTGAAVVAASISGGRSAAAQTAVKRPLKKAVNLGMVKVEGSTLEKFKLLAELGFDGVELNRPGGPAVDEVLQTCKTTGLPVAGIMNADHWRLPLSDPDPAVRAQGLDGLRTALREAKTFGAPTVLLVPAVVKKEVSYEEAWIRSQAEIRKVIPLAEELGVKIAIENVGNYFLLSPLEAARYVDEFRSSAVGWHFDVGNIVRTGWPEQWIRILGQRIINVHIKESSRPKPSDTGRRSGVELLEGDCDWPAVMKAFDEIGYRGWAIAEVPGGDAGRLRFLAERMDRIFAS